MPEIGEIRKAFEIGKTPQNSQSKYQWWKYAKYIWVACESCGKERWVLLRKGHPENLKCSSCGKSPNLPHRWGTKSSHWKGGKIKQKGYIMVRLSPDDFFYPMANYKSYVFEHRLVVAKALGRCLHSWEIVHHKRGFAKDDNRYPETLELVMEGQHNQITFLENRIKYLEVRVTKLEAENVLLQATIATNLSEYVR